MVPVIPCSGLNSATSSQTSDLKSSSMVVFPSAARPVWLVIRPTRLPDRTLNRLARKTSIPFRTLGELAAVADEAIPNSNSSIQSLTTHVIASGLFRQGSTEPL